MVATRDDSNLAGMKASLIHKPGSTQHLQARKSADGKTGWVEGYLVSWGNNHDTDLQGEFFSPRTEFCLDWFQDRPVLYHHGLDGQAGLRKIGSIKTVDTDDLGLWVQAQLDLRDRYANAVYDMVKTKEFGWSSGSVDHLVKIAPNGEIAVWPLIEGSITPTPAQPSKTLVRPLKSGELAQGAMAQVAPTTSLRAFKALLSGDETASEYLRGLEARVDSAGYVRAKSSLYVPNHLDSNGTQGESTAQASKRLARHYANAFGVKANERQLDAVAMKLEGRVDEEVATAAAEELEMEAALASLEQEMIQEDNSNMQKSYGNSRRNVNTRSRRSAYRADDSQLPSGAGGQLAAQFDDNMAAQMDDIAQGMAAEIAADMEDQLKAEQDEINFQKAAVNALKRRARKQALRQLQATDDIDATFYDAAGMEAGGDGAGEEGSFYLGDLAQDDPIPNMKRYGRRQPQRSVARRGYARRDGMPADPNMSMQAEMDAYSADPTAVAPLASQDNAIMMEEVARRSYHNGFRRGARNAFRATDGIGDSGAILISEQNDEAGNYGLVSADGGSITSGDNITASGKRLTRNRRAARGYAYRDDAAIVPPEAPATQAEADEMAVTSAFRKGYRAAIAKARAARGYARRDGLTPDVPLDPSAPVAGDMDFGGMQADDNFASPPAGGTMADDEFGAPVASYRRYNAGAGRNMPAKSAISGYSQYDYDKQAEYWRNRAMKAEMMEAPDQRGFGSVKSVRDVSDMAGAYDHAFKSYLYQGTSLMSPTEIQVLKGKGTVNYKGMKSYESPLGVDPRVKTYFGGSDASVGFAVPPDWVAELNKNVMTQTVMAPECRTRTTTSDRIVQPNLVTADARRAHAAVVRWPGEVITDGNVSRTIEDTFSQVEVPINVMLISLTSGNSALEDVTFSLEDEINEAFSEAVAVAYDQLIWSGDGQGKLQGIVVNNQVVGHVSQNMQTVSGYVASGSPDGIVTADVLKELLFHLPRGYRQRAKWYMNSNTGLQIATLKDGEGNYLIDQRDESLQSVGVPDRLLGKPIVYNEYADDIVEGGYPIVLGDLSRGYIIGKRVDFSIRRFDDSQYAELDQVLFLGRARLGGQVLQPAAIKVLKVAAS